MSVPPVPGPSPLAIGFRTVVGNAVLFVATIVFGTLGMVFGLVPPRGTVTWWCARAWSRILLAAAGLRVDVEHAVPLDRATAYVFMANHQSMFDIPVLISTLPGQTRFLAKSSLFRIPIFGWALWAGGFVPVERGDRSRARVTMAAASDRLRRGNSLLIFPEETRSRDGRLLPFKSGGFLLAAQAGVAVVPVGISGTLDVQPKGSAIIRPTRVTVRYGEPVMVPVITTPRERRAVVAGTRDTVARLAATTCVPRDAAADGEAAEIPPAGAASGGASQAE